MTKLNAIIIPGHNTTPDMHWYQSTKNSLEELGIKTIIIPARKKEEETLENRLKDLSAADIDENTILIGHSLGALTLLSFLEDYPDTVKHTYLVAGLTRPKEIPEKYQELTPFIKKDFKLKKIRKKCPFTVINSTNDPTIPLEYAINLATDLKTPLHIIDNAGHFKSQDGFNDFPYLIEEIKKHLFVSYDEFKKMDLRIGLIKEATPVEGSDKLLKCHIDFGNLGERTIVSGIKGYVGDSSNIIGKSVLYITNLPKRKIMGIESEGMLMAIGDDQTEFSFVITEKEVAPGSKIR